MRGTVFDQVLVVVVEAQGGLLNFDGDGLPAYRSPDLDALAGDLGTVAAKPGALHRARRWPGSGAGASMRVGLSVRGFGGGADAGKSSGVEYRRDGIPRFRRDYSDQVGIDCPDPRRRGSLTRNSLPPA